MREHVPELVDDGGVVNERRGGIFSGVNTQSATWKRTRETDNGTSDRLNVFPIEEAR